MQTSTQRWPATSAAAAHIPVSVPRSSRRRALARKNPPASAARRDEMNNAALTENRAALSHSRRTFLKLTATVAIGGGLMIGFGLSARAEIRDSFTADAPFAPNALLRIDRSGKVTFVMPVIEMGQGTYTSLPMLIAEELE